MEECLHLSVTDDGICIECGVDINSEEFLASLPPLPEGSIGDIVSIIRLAQETADEYTQKVQENTDPKHPNLPRLQLIGGMLVRLSHESLWKRLLPQSFATAKTLGYRGNYQKWGVMVRELASKQPEVL